MITFVLPSYSRLLALLILVCLVYPVGVLLMDGSLKPEIYGDLLTWPLFLGFIVLHIAELALAIRACKKGFTDLFIACGLVGIPMAFWLGVWIWAVLVLRDPTGIGDHDHSGMAVVLLPIGSAMCHGIVYSLLASVRGVYVFCAKRRHRGMHPG